MAWNPRRQNSKDDVRIVQRNAASRIVLNFDPSASASLLVSRLPTAGTRNQNQNGRDAKGARSGVKPCRDSASIRNSPSEQPVPQNLLRNADPAPYCRSTARKARVIVDDNSHVLAKHYERLPSGRRFHVPNQIKFCSAVNSICEQVNLFKRKSSVCVCVCVSVCVRVCVNYLKICLFIM